jgi:hypothetical protein
MAASRDPRGSRETNSENKESGTSAAGNKGMRSLRWRRQQDESGLSVTIGQPAQLKSVSFKKVLEGRRKREQEDSDTMVHHAEDMAHFPNHSSTSEVLRGAPSGLPSEVSPCPHASKVYVLCLIL